jgi:hypothetical protein
MHTSHGAAVLGIAHTKLQKKSTMTKCFMDCECMLPIFNDIVPDDQESPGIPVEPMRRGTMAAIACAISEFSPLIRGINALGRSATRRCNENAQNVKFYEQ